MNTPLRKAVEAYLGRNAAWFHMPGHKGSPVWPLSEAARYDITEVAGADSLYEAEGPIAETEERFRALYGSHRSFLSAGGSTLCIQTMLALATSPGDTVLCARGAHTAALNAMALLDLHPRWICPAVDPVTGLSMGVTPEQVDSALSANPEAAAVYITSPTYFGVLSDVEGISQICRRHSVPLLVDNAHGAHLRFLRPDLHPMTLGADLCCDSLHKTLPVLTGGAVLHLGSSRFAAEAKQRMSLFGSTSPSYLILLSLDGVLPWLEGPAANELAQTCERVAALKTLAAERGFLLPGGCADPLRVSLGFGPLGFTADSFRTHLARHGIEPEYCSDHFCVLLAGPHNADGDFHRLHRAIDEAPHSENCGTVPRCAVSAELPALPEQALSPRQVAFAPTVSIPVDQAAGRIAGSAVAPCPPGIPLVMPGERLDRETGALLKSYGILDINVIK